MSRTKTMRIATFAVFMAVAAFAAKPAQAKRGVVSGYNYGYKYVAVEHDLGYTAHVVQVDFLNPIGGYREGGKIPSNVFGFGIAVGGNHLTKIRNPRTGDSINLISPETNKTLSRISVYLGVPLIYEYVFANGWGVSGGVGFSFMVIGDNPEIDGGGAFGAGIGLSDLGVNYHFKNGLTLYSRVNLGYSGFFTGYSRFLEDSFGEEFSTNGLIWGVGAGVGYWF